MELDDWDRAEIEWYEERQRKADRVRVIGFALVTANAAIASRKVYEAAADRLVRARLDVDHAEKRMLHLLDVAEAAARVATSGDASWQAEVAMHLERLVG